MYDLALLMGQAMYVSEAHLKKNGNHFDGVSETSKGGWERKPTPVGAAEEVHLLRVHKCRYCSHHKNKKP